MQFLPLVPTWGIIVLAAVLVVPCIIGIAMRRGSLVGWLRRLGIALLILVIAMRPITSDEAISHSRLNANVFFVVDRTGSMNAEDHEGFPTRIDGVTSDMNAIVDALAGARFSIIAFDSVAASHLPLTTDGAAVRAWSDTLSTEYTSRSSGSNVDRPLDVLLQQVSRTVELDPDSHVIVFFLSDGENTDSSTPRSFSSAAQYIDAGAVLGYGTAAGGPMKIVGGPEAGEYIQDPAGGRGISMIDERTLTTIAQELGVAYVHRPGSLEDIEATFAHLDLHRIEVPDEQRVPAFEDWYWIAAILVSLLALWDMIALLRSMPRPPRTDALASATRSQRL